MVREQRGRNDHAPWGAEGSAPKARKPVMSVKGKLGTPHEAKEEGEGVPIQEGQQGRRPLGSKKRRLSPSVDLVRSLPYFLDLDPQAL